MQITVCEETTRERADRAELLITVKGEPAALMILALESADRDAEGLAGSVREQLCDLVDRLDDWIRSDGRIIVSRGASPCHERRRLVATPEWAQDA
jgi:hypothetical protein